MACNLSQGRTEPCKDVIGGIQAVYFINYERDFRQKCTFDGTNTNVIDSFTASAATAYKYELKDASSFTENIQSDRETGSTAFEQVLEATFKKLSFTDHEEFEAMAKGRPIVIIKDNNDNCMIAGLDYGMELTAGVIQTGSAKTDLTGYTITLTGMEKQPAYWLNVDVESIAGLTIA